MNNANEAFSSDSLFKAITTTYSSPSFYLTPSFPVSPPSSAGVFDAVHVPFFRTPCQGHSQPKCMLMVPGAAWRPLDSLPDQMWHWGLPGKRTVDEIRQDS